MYVCIYLSIKVSFAKCTGNVFFSGGPRAHAFTGKQQCRSTVRLTVNKLCGTFERNRSPQVNRPYANE